MTADRIAKIIAMAPAQVREHFDFDAGHIVGMALARLAPSCDFDRMVNSARISSSGNRASRRTALRRGQFGEDFRPIHFSHTSTWRCYRPCNANQVNSPLAVPPAQSAPQSNTLVIGQVGIAFAPHLETGSQRIQFGSGLQRQQDR
jgi:hypothetical protein